MQTELLSDKLIVSINKCPAIAYMHTLPDIGALVGGLIYPTSEIAQKRVRKLNGYRGTLYTIPVHIPQSSNYADFCKEMEKSAEQRSNIIETLKAECVK